MMDDKCSRALFRGNSTTECRLPVVCYHYTPLPARQRPLWERKLILQCARIRELATSITRSFIASPEGRTPACLMAVGGCQEVEERAPSVIFAGIMLLLLPSLSYLRVCLCYATGFYPLNSFIYVRFQYRPLVTQVKYLFYFIIIIIILVLLF